MLTIRLSRKRQAVLVVDSMQWRINGRILYSSDGRRFHFALRASVLIILRDILRPGVDLLHTTSVSVPGKGVARALTRLASSKDLAH